MIDLRNSTVSPALLVFPKRRAFARFFHIWGQGDASTIRRGIGARKAQHIHSLLGNSNGDAGLRGPLRSYYKDKKRIWYLLPDRTLYDVEPLPQTGVEQAREIARSWTDRY
jgi:hypothetical protein